jgi:hypothetical protein
VLGDAFMPGEMTGKVSGLTNYLGSGIFNSPFLQERSPSISNGYPVARFIT